MYEKMYVSLLLKYMCGRSTEVDRREGQQNEGSGCVAREKLNFIPALLRAFSPFLVNIPSLVPRLGGFWPCQNKMLGAEAWRFLIYFDPLMPAFLQSKPRPFFPRAKPRCRTSATHIDMGRGFAPRKKCRKSTPKLEFHFFKNEKLQVPCVFSRHF